MSSAFGVAPGKFKKNPNFKTSRRFNLKYFKDGYVEENQVFIVNENQKYFLSKFKAKECFSNQSLTSQYMGKVLSGENDDEEKYILEILLKKGLSPSIRLFN